MSIRQVPAGLTVAALLLVGCCHSPCHRPAPVVAAPPCCAPAAVVPAAPVPVGAVPAPTFAPPPGNPNFGR